jgi:hypothetical protein
MSRCHRHCCLRPARHVFVFMCCTVALYIVYVTLWDICIAANDVTSLLNCVSIIHRYQWPWQVKDYYTILKRLSYARLVPAVMAVFTYMEKMGVHVNADLFNEVMTVFVLSADPRGGEFVILLSRGIMVRCYNNMSVSVCLSFCVIVLSMVAEMKSQGIAPDPRTYANMVAVYLRAADEPAAMTVLDQFEQQQDYPVSHHPYTAAIVSHCACQPPFVLPRMVLIMNECGCIIL